MKLFFLRNKVGNKWIMPFAALVFIMFIITTRPSLPGAGLSLFLFALSFLSCVIYLYFRGFKDGAEIRLLFLFGVWFALTRIINGDYFLRQDTVQTLLQCMVFVLPTAGMLLPKKAGRKFLLWAGIIVCVIYSVVSVLGIYSAITGVDIVNARDGSFITKYASASKRLQAFGRNPNYISVCFMEACIFAVYLFVRAKNGFVKALLVPAFILNYIAVGLTYSRNVMLGSSIAFAALIYLLVQKKLRIRNVKLQAVTLLAVMCICTPLIYSSFTASRSAVSYASELAAPQQAAAEAASAEDAAVTEKTDTDRGMKDSGRLPIWKSIFPVLKADPSRLLVGRVNVMEASNAYFEEQWFVHGNAEYEVVAKKGGSMYYHNTFIQLLMAAGIPGLLIVLAFLVLLAVHALRVFFAAEGKTAAGDKVLTMMLAALVCYNMFECSIFCNTTLASASFFIISGFVIAYSREIKAAE